MRSQIERDAAYDGALQERHLALYQELEERDRRGLRGSRGLVGRCWRVEETDIPSGEQWPGPIEKP